ncbi:MAG TPA: ATP-dependent Clp protease proteolytic subunit [Cyclobacteriaceae bacterium]|jgi:ATP-dependent protease ClpP protease subunit|nr:ATP-dependent Clp protease proteolytic subunit [Cyclobacteriaceae bacterium]
MAKEIRLYGSFNDYSADEFLAQLAELKKEDVLFRVNSNGGDPQSGFGMIASWRDYKGKKKIQTDGKAYSMAFYFLCYADEVSALDVSDFLVHRAAYPSSYEQSEYMTDDQWATLDRINGFLRAALEAKIDVKKFEKMKNVKLDDIFSNDKRVDVKLTAQEAKEIGLVNEIIPITPQIKSEINEYAFRIAALSVEMPQQKPEQKIPEQKKPPEKNKAMTPEEITALVNGVLTKNKEQDSAIAKAKEDAIKAERKRIAAWKAFDKIDAVAVNKGIDSGEEITMSDIAEFQAKALSPENLKAIADASPKKVETAEAETTVKTDEQKRIEVIETGLDKLLNIKK